jgi:hypothetical protein
MAYSILPILPNAVPCSPYTQSIDNTIDGVTHRIGRDKPRVVIDRRHIRHLTRMICRDVFDLSSYSPMSFDEWLDNTHYTRSRKQNLRKLAATFDYEDTSLLKRAKTKSFIKKEFYPTYKNARMICSRDDTAKIITGPIFKAIENVIFKNPSFIKKVPVKERAAYVVDHLGDTTDCKLYVNDHTSFETHAHSTMRDIECVVYAQMMRKTQIRDISRMLCGKQRISGRGWCASVNSRMSGEMNTSLGNGIANLFSFLIVVALKYGYSRIRDVKCVIEGDDAIFCVPRDIEITTEDFAQLGFVVVLEEKQTLGECGFCSTYFSEDGQHAVVEPMKALGAIGWSFARIPMLTCDRIRDLQGSKAISFHVEYSGLPILHEIGLRLMDEYFDPRRKLVLGWYEKYMLGDVRNVIFNSHVTYQSRVLFEKMFGYTVAEQLACEEYVRTSNLMSILDHPVITARIPGIWLQNFAKYAMRARVF